MAHSLDFYKLYKSLAAYSTKNISIVLHFVTIMAIISIHMLKVIVTGKAIAIYLARKCIHITLQNERRECKY